MQQFQALQQQQQLQHQVGNLRDFDHINFFCHRLIKH
jgi:hypothetical protein